MSVRRTFLFIALAAIGFEGLLENHPLQAQTIQVTNIVAGYEVGSITLPDVFAGGLAADPSNDQLIYASVGSFHNNSIARIDLTDGSAQTVAAGPFGSILGIVAISPTALVLVESDAPTGGGTTTDTLILARDFNPQDGDFDDPGEIGELIAPILTNSGNFNGAQARLVPPGNPSGIPSGSILLQTADGNGLGELLVITSPLTAPAFRPLGAPYYAGFDYNGGMDFDSQGRLMMGTVEGAGFTGEIHGLVNTNADEDTDAGESHTLLAGVNGMADLVIDAEDDVLFAGADASFVAAVQTFHVPADPLTGTVSPTTLAETDSGFMLGILINSKTRPFEPGPVAGGATLLVGGLTGSFTGATNLLTLTPTAPLGARQWRAYE